MKIKDSIFLKVLGTVLIEVLFFSLCLIIIGFIVLGIREVNILGARIFFYISSSLYIIYLLFSNTKYKSISAILLKYNYYTEKWPIIKICISNIIFYGLVFGFFG
jgi:hypothetical protein